MGMIATVAGENKGRGETHTGKGEAPIKGKLAHFRTLAWGGGPRGGGERGRDEEKRRGREVLNERNRARKREKTEGKRDTRGILGLR